MIDVYYWPTPNGHKVTIFLEEAGLPYTIKTVNIMTGEQFEPSFLAISPNNRMPAIVDHAPADGGAAQSVFESGAILIYLAEKTGLFLPTGQRERVSVLEWLFWQVGGLGPMAGQNGHFRRFAPEKIEYAITRYGNEVDRLYCVLNRQLAGRDYVCGSYSVADMASYPWVANFEMHGVDLGKFPHVEHWIDVMKARPAVAKAYAKPQELGLGGPPPPQTDEARKILFGQTSAVTR